MKKARAILGAILLPAVLLMAVCACTGSPDAGPGEVPVINLGLMPDVESIPFVVAELNDYYDPSQVKVQLHYFKSAKDRDSALQSGELDGVVNDMVAVLFSHAGGLPLLAVADSNSQLSLLGNPVSGPQGFTADQVADKSLGLSLNTVMEYNADQMLATLDYTIPDAAKVAIPQIPTRLEMLQSGQLDMAIMPEPFATIAQQAGAVRLMNSNQMEHKAGVISFRQETVAEHPAAVRATVQAYYQAGESLNKEGAAPYIEQLIAQMGLPEASRTMDFLPEYQVSFTSEDSFNSVQQWLLAKDLLTQPYKYQDVVVNWDQLP